MPINPPKLYFYILWTVLAMSFIFFAVILLMEANGYRFNYRTHALEKTGMIVFDGSPRNISLSINGQGKKVNLPYKASKLMPGRFNVEITAEKYNLWSKNFDLNAGQAIDSKKVFLFYKSPEFKETTDQNAKDRLKNDYNDQSKNVEVKNSEIWYNKKFITRFSQQVESAIVSDYFECIFFQTGQEIRVVSLDGSNNILLLKLVQNRPTNLSFNGSKLTFLDNDKVYEALVR